MEKLLFDNTLYNYYEYPSEKEFEKVIISQSANIFGSDSLYAVSYTHLTLPTTTLV